MNYSFPERGFVFWPIGTGDSTTIVIDDDTVVQVDLRHQAQSEDEDNPHAAIIDELEEKLPKQNDRPYLAVFALTHPDQDHIQGFEELLDRIDIGEIWHTPRIFTENDSELCDDAEKFKEEVERRRKKTVEAEGDVKSGDRVLVIGYDELFDDGEFKDFPEEWRAYPASTITRIDGSDREAEFEAFVHAPFKDDDGSKERNETSLALQITLTGDDSDHVGKALLLGDLSYPTIRRVFDKTKEKERPERLEWDIFLAPHHCSKKALFWKGEDDETEQLQKEMVQDIEEAGLDGAYIIASAESKFTDEKNANPPHRKARKQYEGIVDAGHFICTHEHPNKKTPSPVVFELDESGFELADEADDQKSESVAKAATAIARGSQRTSDKPVGFGRRL